MKIEVEKLVLGMVSTNVYLVFYNGNCLIIDPSDEAERIIDCIEERKAKPLAILFTHGHFDHIMAAPALVKKYGIKIYAGEADRQLLEDSNLNLSRRFLGEDFTLEADEYVKGGDELGLKALSLRSCILRGILWEVSAFIRKTSLIMRLLRRLPLQEIPCLREVWAGLIYLQEMKTQ